MGRFGNAATSSTGIHIVHFTIIHLLLHTGCFGKRPGLFVACAVVLTVAGAALLWHLVEKHFLARRPA